MSENRSEQVRIQFKYIPSGGSSFDNRQSFCPFSKRHRCTLAPIDCRYGLTEVRPPEDCPLRAKVLVSLVVDEEENNDD